MTTRINFLLLFLYSTWTTNFAQNVPTNVTASDGTYKKYVLVSWDTLAESSQYKVYRGTSTTIANLTEVSNDWQKSTTFYDHSVVPDVQYYYRVVAQQAENAYSEADLGFIKGTAIAANFTPNTYLEPLVNSLRSDDYNFTINSPVADTVFTAPLDAVLTFSGRFTADDFKRNQVLNVSVFSNQEEAYINEEPLSKQTLVLQKIAANHNFSSSIPMPDGSGLYYIVVTLEGDDEPIFVEKFQIE